MACGVAWRVENLRRESAKRDRIAVAHLNIDTRYAVGLILRADNGAAGLALEFQVPARVVRMIMRRQYVGESPTLFRQCLFHRRRFRRVDRCCYVVFRIMYEDAVIVAQAGKLVNFECGHRVGPLDCYFSGNSGNLSPMLRISNVIQILRKIGIGYHPDRNRAETD